MARLPAYVEILVLNRYTMVSLVMSILYVLQQVLHSVHISVHQLDGLPKYLCIIVTLLASVWTVWSSMRESMSIRSELEDLRNRNLHHSETLLQLAACSINQLMPLNHDLPADLFTACLLTSIKVAPRC